MLLLPKKTRTYKKILVAFLLLCASYTQALCQPTTEKPKPDKRGNVTIPAQQFDQLLSASEHYAKLFSLMTFWLGTPYLRGGTSPSGVDCSGFTYALCRDMYNIKLPRTSQEQYQQVTLTEKDLLTQGDLVFFNGGADSSNVSHVGVYLGNGKFMHAATSGVKIDSLESDYYKTHYVGGGKVKE